jgi:myosin-5
VCDVLSELPLLCVCAPCRQVEAKYPALLFKQQLDAFVQKIFPMMRDNVKKQITPMLANCIHTPRGVARGGQLTRRCAAGSATSICTVHCCLCQWLCSNAGTQHRHPITCLLLQSASMPLLYACLCQGQAGISDRCTSLCLSCRGSNQDPSSTTPQLSRYWSDILGVFDVLLATVKEAHVPRVLVQALFRQLFSFVNVQLFNQLLLRRECCSFSNGEYVKTGLAQVENWISEAGQDYVGESWDELKYIRQAVTFLVIGNKPKKSLDEITHDLCPVLSIQQVRAAAAAAQLRSRLPDEYVRLCNRASLGQE